MELLPTNDTLGILRKSAENMKKCKPEGKIVPKGTEYIDHSGLLGNESDLRLHIKKLEEYLKDNPGDMETRISLANLKNMFS